MPRQVNGVWISDDGRWRWDGHAWQPVQPPPTRKPNLWLRVGLVVFGLAVVIGVLGAIGWLVAIGGVALVAAVFARPGLRSWAGWNRVPGLSSTQSAAAFAVVLALYAVVAPAGIWAVALAGGSSNTAQVSSAPPPTSNDGPVAVSLPTATPMPSPTPTGTPTPTPTPTATPTPAPPTSTPAAAAPPTSAPAAAPPPGCYPLTNAGNCYSPGEYCRNSDHGATGRAANGEAIVCRNNNGWRWEPA
jgi:hypothetical protein